MPCTQTLGPKPSIAAPALLLLLQQLPLICCCCPRPAAVSTAAAAAAKPLTSCNVESHLQPPAWVQRHLAPVHQPEQAAPGDELRHDGQLVGLWSSRDTGAQGQSRGAGSMSGAALQRSGDGLGA
jgi:hypothetical protein